MEDTKNINDSFNEVKIYKPKVVRLCPSQKSTKSSLSSSTSTVNSELSINQFIAEETKETKIDLENITIEEINTDFFIYGQYLEEEECHNELYDIINNSSENEIKEKNIEKKDIQKVKRCENPLKKELETLENSYFDELMEELNDFCCEKEKEENKEKN